MTPSTLLERVPARRSTTPRPSTPRRSTTPRPSTPRASGGSTLVLGVILTCYLMIILDVSVVITALPDIRRAFGFSPTGLS
jgi:hypothetical protein